ncbi:MAG: thioredoxin family protein [Bordetella sp.]|nr:MAG: thioredoxin family protein [Bordetella sp.]
METSIYLIICFCANWCSTCRKYIHEFRILSTNLPEYNLHWVDIENNPDLLYDEDVENFPTILIQKQGQTVFFGSILPHIFCLKRLIKNIDLYQNNNNILTSFPDMRSFFK